MEYFLVDLVFDPLSYYDFLRLYSALDCGCHRYRLNFHRITVDNCCDEVV